MPELKGHAIYVNYDHTKYEVSCEDEMIARLEFSLKELMNVSLEDVHAWLESTMENHKKNCPYMKET